jgi:hypothetical protein
MNRELETLVKINGLKYVLKLVLIYFASNFMVPVILTILAFLIICDINLFQGNMAFLFSPRLAPFFTWLFGSPMTGNLSFDNHSLMSVLNKASLVVMVVSIILHFINKLIFRKEMNLKRAQIFGGLGLLTLVFAAALGSVFVPQAAHDSISTAPVIVIFYLVSIVAFLISSGINWLITKLE